jgi:hypothetical protein
MALFTDGISTIQDLTVQDSSVLATAQTENIDLSQKLTLAQQELGIEITALLQQRSNTCDWQFWLQPDLQLNNIVVTPPLQFWHVFQTLMLTYQDAYFNQLNDRYQGKRDQFQQLAKWALNKLIQTGIGIALNPIPQAAPPQLTSIPGGQPAMTYCASVSWLNVENEEGQPSNPSVLTVAAGNALVVQPVNQPANATAWNVYVGLTPTALALQNTSPQALDQVWVQAAPVSTLGQTPGCGQAPDYLRALPRVIQRG